jgi:hypothetical protein
MYKMCDKYFINIIIGNHIDGATGELSSSKYKISPTRLILYLLIMFSVYTLKALETYL